MSCFLYFLCSCIFTFEFSWTKFLPFTFVRTFAFYLMNQSQRYISPVRTPLCDSLPCQEGVIKNVTDAGPQTTFQMFRLLILSLLSKLRGKLSKNIDRKILFVVKPYAPHPTPPPKKREVFWVRYCQFPSELVFNGQLMIYILAIELVRWSQTTRSVGRAYNHPLMRPNAVFFFFFLPLFL